MPTTAELDRLKVLTKRLGPLATAAPGQLILAESWNLLVGVVGELARALLAQDHEVQPAAHEHVDQVSLGWLEPSLRALIQRGPLSDPAAESRLAEVARRLDRVDKRSDGLGDALDELRGTLDGVATRDLVREAQLTETQRTVESQSGAGDDVQALRETLRSVQDDVLTAVDLGRKLVVDGEPFDPAKLVERVSAVEQLRERLRGPDGELFDASALERRLTELTNTLVTQETLDEALAKARGGGLDDAQLGELEERLRVSAASAGEAAARRATDELRDELGKALAGVDEQVVRGVSDAIPGLREQLEASQREALEQAIGGARKETQTLVDERLQRLEADTTAALRVLDEQARAFAMETAKQLADAAASGVRAELATRLAQLDEETARLSRTQTQITRANAVTAGRVEQLAQQEAIARDLQISALREEQRTALARVESRTLDIDERVDAIVAQRLDERLAGIDESIEKRVSVRIAEVQAAITRTVRADISTIADRVTTLEGRIQRIQ